MDIHLVVGETGEYSDHTEWFVAAYPNKTVAEEHAKLATEHVERVKNGCENPYDKSCEVDYSGTSYYVATVPLIKNVGDYLVQDVN